LQKEMAADEQNQLILAEFHEFKGPTVLHLLPSTADHSDALGIAQRVLSIDFDTDLDISLQWRDHAHLSLHYFSLRDWDARGHWRRLCLCFAAPHQPVGVESGFARVVRMMKDSNRGIWVDELLSVMSEGESEYKTRNACDLYVSSADCNDEKIRNVFDICLNQEQYSWNELKGMLEGVGQDRFLCINNDNDELKSLSDLIGDPTERIVYRELDKILHESRHGFVSLDLWDRMPLDSAKSLLDLCTRYSFAKSIIYSVLISRPVWIIGLSDKQDQIEQLVSGLKYLVPASREERIEQWLKTKSVSLQEINQYQLVGCAVKIAALERYRTLITIVNLDDETLCGPLYNGTLIESTIGSLSHSTDFDTVVACVSKMLHQFRSLSQTVAKMMEDKSTIVKSDSFEPYEDEWFGTNWTISSSSMSRRDRNQSSANWHTLLGGQSRRRNSQEKPRTVMDVFPSLSQPSIALTLPADECIYKSRSASIEGINEKFLSVKHSTALDTAEASGIFSATTFFTPDTSAAETKRTGRRWFSYFRKTPEFKSSITVPSDDDTQEFDTEASYRQQIMDLLQVYGNDRLIIMNIADLARRALISTVHP
jgi:hypothetical protein